MTFEKSITRTLVAALVFTVAGVPEMLGQSTQPPAQTAPAPNDNSQTTNPNDPRFSGVRPDPSAGPQSPNLAPQAPENTAPQQQPELPAAPQPQQAGAATASQAPHEAPSGTATAEKAATRGGAASKPAGTAIAPAKQRQARSLLIKFGVLAAAGVAVGAIAGLSRGTPSIPPGAKAAAVTH